MKRSEFNKVFSDLNEETQDFFSEENMLKRIKEINDGQPGLSLENAVIFLELENMVFTQKFVYSVLEKLFDIEEDLSEEEK